MKNTDLMINFCNSQLSNKFFKLVEPIADCYGLDVILFTKIGEDGSFFQVSNYSDLINFYWNGDLYLSNPFIRHPKQYTTGSVMLTDYPSEEFQRTLICIKKFYNSNYLMASFIKNDREVYWIAYSSKNSQLPLVNLFVNERVVLEKFSQYIVKEWKQFTLKMEDYTIDMAEVLGELEFKKEFPKMKIPNLNKKKYFLKRTGLIDKQSLIPDFTLREVECISFLFKGKTAPQIADILNLSPRTVEYYIENIKNKLDCTSKSETIEKALELKELGLL